MSESRSVDIVFALGVGIVVGAVTALLLAPSSGEEIRNRIGEAAKGASGKAKEGADTAANFLKDQKERLGHAIEEGKRAYQEGTQTG